MDTPLVLLVLLVLSGALVQLRASSAMQDTKLDPQNRPDSPRARRAGNSFRERVESRLRLLEGQLSALNSSYRQLETRNQELEGQLSALNSSNRQLEIRNQELEGQLSALNSSNGQLETRVQVLDRTDKTLEGEIAALVNSSQLLETRTDSLDTEYMALEQRVRDLAASVGQPSAAPQFRCTTGDEHFALGKILPARVAAPYYVAKREQRVVTFSSRFTSTPKVAVFLVELDVDNKHNTRIRCFEKNVAVTGFQLECFSWSDTHLYSVKAGWIACGRQ